MQTITSDVLIIGSGIAGLSAALEVSRSGKRALVVSKAPLGKANNTYLAGGLFSFSESESGVSGFLAKTLHSGRGINRAEMVEVFAREAHPLVGRLREWGMSGAALSGGFVARDASFIGGPNISSSLLRAFRGAGLAYREGVAITDLISSDGRCLGALGTDKRSGDLLAFPAGAVLLATGGAGSIYVKNNNAPAMTGDGYALGLKAGLELLDMEFVQFYPMGRLRRGQTRTLVPAFFADLGRLTNRLGEDIKEKYDLEDRPIAVASRDRFSRAVLSEIREGLDVGGGILLDMRGVAEKDIPFPQAARDSLKRILSYHKEPIPIAPACHYFMGGLSTDTSGATGLKGFYAAGEVVGGTHGANRRGGSALSESLVFGVRAARAAVEEAGEPLEKTFREVARHTVHTRAAPRPGRHLLPAQVSASMDTLLRTLWEKVGILRDENSLRESIARIDSILDSLGPFPGGGPELVLRYLACRNAAYTGRAVAVSALKRTESRGAHHRTDFPGEDATWLKHIHVRMVNDLPEAVGTTDC